MNPSSVSLQPGSIWIDGQPQILLTSSLFYFRIPSSEWRARMHTLRLLGYNAIDVYFPWNYHELTPGQWDFSGERDVNIFLQQAKDEGLWVIARPGPYICSEWDGGSLPAYLSAEPDLQLRDNSPKYLEAVRRWYEHILPLVAPYQADRGGTVVLLQIENELDFFNCSDRTGMMTALRDMALAQGITVPIIACAGQGDIPGATGGVEGVVPACNVYFDSRDPKLEERIRHYDALLREQGYPLCITETNRLHTDLRRLIAGGAKLVGPYLQTGGTDFGFTTSVTNWGEPLAFMTSYYDFGGMISPSGKVRPEGQEAILLSKMIQALGPALALAAPAAKLPVLVHGVDGQALALNGGGWLIGLPNPQETTACVTLGAAGEQFPAKTDLIIAPNTCPFVLMNYPLLGWGIDGYISYATSELVECLAHENVLELTFAVNGVAEVKVDWPKASLGYSNGWQVESTEVGLRLWTDSDVSAEVELIGQTGKQLIIRGVKRSEISNLDKVGLDAGLVVSTPAEARELDFSHISWRMASTDPCGQEWYTGSRSCEPGKLHLEGNSIFRGYGWYRVSAAFDHNVQGFLVQSGADVLSLYLNKHYLGTIVPGGGDAYVALSKDLHFTGSGQLVVRAEIWGHANFDDHRLPALRLNSMRGMTGMVAVHKTENITPNWYCQHRTQNPAQDIDSFWPLLYFGGWSSTEEPQRGVYYKKVCFEEGMDIRVLSFPGLQATAQVYLNEQRAGLVNPFNPFVDISSLSKSGATATIAVAVDQDFRRPAGQVLLYEGRSLQGWELAGWNDIGLANLAEKHNTTEEVVNFPISLKDGDMAWLYVDLPLSSEWKHGWNLKLAGQGVKVSAWMGRHMIGRIWLPSEMRPRMVGGVDDQMVLPSDWLHDTEGKLCLLLESVSQDGQLSSVKFVEDT